MQDTGAVPDDAVAPRAQLLAELDRTRAVLADLSAELAAIEETTEQKPDDEHDAEGSTVAYERARATALRLDAKRRLVKLEAALDRISRGEDQHCTRCGSIIPEERLAALPEASLCVACASDHFSPVGRSHHRPPAAQP